MMGTLPSCHASSKNVTVFDQVTGLAIVCPSTALFPLSHTLRHQNLARGETPMINVKAQAYVFDAYGTLFDVHAAIARHRPEAGPDAERFSEIWRIKQLEYTWTLTLAGTFVDFWT